MTGPGRNFDVLHDAVEATLGASTLEATLEALVRSLEGELSLSSAGVFLHAGEVTHLVGLWPPSAVPFFEKGVEINPNLTRETRALYDVVAGGRIVAFAIGDVDLGLLDAVVHAQGVESWASIPLRRGKEVRGSLVLGSTARDALAARQFPLLEGLGRGIEERILDLADANG